MLGTPPVGLLLLTIWQVVLGHQWGNRPVSNGSLIGWTIFVWLLFVRLATVRLVTDVYPGEVSVAMRGIWRKRRIPRASIRSAKEVSFNPIRDYGGYGIRSTSGGKAYLASGNQGVRLDLDDGSFLLIGSRRADELAKIICINKA